MRFLMVKRLAAFFIDFLIALGLFVLLYNGLLMYLDRIKSELIFDIAQIVAGFIALFWLTLVLFEISALRATIGKLLFSLRVKAIDGGKAGPLRILARNALKLLTVLTFGIGYVLILFRRDRLSLHDLLSGTKAVRLPKPDRAAQKREKEVARKLGKDKENDKPKADPATRILLLKRALALLIDLLIVLGISVLLYNQLLLFLDRIKSELIFDISQIAGGYAAAVFIYLTLFEISPLRATFGKWIFSLKVTGKEGEKASLLRILFRNLAKLLTIATLGIGYLLMIFRSDRRALHDLLTGTRAWKVPRLDKDAMVRVLFRNRWWIMTLSILIAGGVSYSAIDSGQLSKKGPRLVVNLKTTTNDVYELSYDLGLDTGYDSDVVDVSVEPRKQFKDYSFDMPAGKDIHTLRLDLGNTPAKIEIAQLRLEGLTRSYLWTAAQLTNRFTTNEFVSNFRLISNVLTIQSTGTDPYIVFKENVSARISAIAKNDKNWRLGICLVFFLLFWSFSVFVPKKEGLAVMLLGPLIPGFLILGLNMFFQYQLAPYLLTALAILIILFVAHAEPSAGAKNANKRVFPEIKGE